MTAAVILVPYSAGLVAGFLAGALLAKSKRRNVGTSTLTDCRRRWTEEDSLAVRKAWEEGEW